MSDSTSPGSTTAPQGSTALDAALADLAARPRVHELARRAGLSSKEIVAALAAQGVAVGSAQSTVDHDVAVALLTSLLAAPTEPEPAPEAAPEPAPAASPTRRSRGSRRASADTGSAPQSAESAPVAAAEPAPLFLAPAAVPVPDAGPGTAPATDTEPEAGRARRRPRGGRARGADTTLELKPADEGGSADDRQDAAPESEVDLLADLVTPDAAPADALDLAESDADDAGDSGGRRRRRRGRRGRGRVGEQGEDGSEDAESADDDAAATVPTDAEATTEGSDAEASDEESDESEGGNRRRRRRRRRSVGDEAVREDDPDNTVVHVREVRETRTSPSNDDAVQGVRGSTRLEAKRQRRRDSRDSRRRPQILSEAEFLARREAVERVMAVRQRGELAQVALLEDGVLVEHFVSRAGSESLMGNIYLGKVQNVLPSMEAAFVDIGKGRNAVIYAGEVNWEATGLAGKARRIETALSSGDSILVQVSKDPVGHKGARLTTQISLPGRFLVYVPGGGATGISRKLPDIERKRLKSILDQILPEDAGVIIRTAAEGVAQDELVADVERLKAQWEDISGRSRNKQSAPAQLSSEPDTLIKVVRDLFNSDISSLVVDGPEAHRAVADYVNSVAPELAPRVSEFEANGRGDVFAAYRIDEQITKALQRKVHLPSGGSLVIDRTEAMTVVDVNTGKFTGSGGNLEETVTKNNLEAAEEIVRQLRLRDIGGIIVVDFIDMVLESNRELVLRRLTECLGRDRTRHQVAEVTSLGLVQMTRKKMGTGLLEAFSEPCPHCGGRGLLLHDMPTEASETDDDADRRSGRRRGKGQRDNREPVVEQPKIVVPIARKPDPRGPKPPSAGQDHADFVEDAESDALGSAEHRPDPVAAPVDAVSAVLAALDARIAAQGPEGTDHDRATADVSTTGLTGATEEAAAFDAAAPDAVEPRGRRRGRRAAVRPAGAPTPVTGSPANPSSSGPDTTATAAPPTPERVESVNNAEAGSPNTSAIPTGPEAGAADRNGEVAEVSGPKKAAPRRRRAASRPAGPAAAV